jgi:hypothetical protein
VQVVLVETTPEPSPEEAEAILAALAETTPARAAAWAEAALAEGVEQDDPEP